MSKFSSAVQIIDLNDFVSPSQECIKPVKIEKDNTKLKEISFDINGNLLQVHQDGTSKKLEKSKINLSDCLACSGCITSAESILVNQQSTDEFLKTISDTKHKLFIVSISPQARSSLAHHFGTDIKTTMGKLVTYFKNLGARYVFDLSWAKNLSLLESCYEFVERYKAKQTPVYSSNCPGWICYAEKTHPEILPKISTVKSPQQMMGSIVKRFMAQKMNLAPQDVYHVSVMSCFDKKLEASREDFAIGEVQEVDCVLTTSEMESLLVSEYNSLKETSMDTVFANLNENGEILGHRGSSGGYLEIVMRYAAQTLFNVTLGDIVYKNGKNRDYREATLEKNGVKLLHFVQAYGFRNIQNVVKKNSSTLHYIEVMACPSGCLNGGGQIKPKFEGVKGKEYYEQLEKVHHSVSIKFDIWDKQVKSLYEEWVKGGINSQEAKILLHTQYHGREQVQSNPLTIKW